MCETLDVFLLAVLQGIAEFLPISSSGHLVLAQSLLKINNPGVRLEVVLHLGTLVSIFLFYRTAIARLIRGWLQGDRASWQTAGHLAISAMPAIFFYVLCHDKIDAFFEDSRAVGGFLIFTGAVLCSLRWMAGGNGGVTAARALLVGIAQALAVLPGISRSGMTISAARMAGIAPDKAAEFSFLMSTPLLIGAALMDFTGITPSSAAHALPAWLLLTAAGISAVVGYVAISLLVRVLRAGGFWMFGLYCFLAGLATLLFA